MQPSLRRAASVLIFLLLAVTVAVAMAAVQIWDHAPAILLAASGTGLLITFGGEFYLRKLLARLSTLERVARAIGSGDTDARFPVGAGDEIDRLSAALNAALDELDDSYAQLQESLEERARELERSNAELEQFAYVASHDLQEPLRKVASFCQLLRQRYHGQLDADADRFIQYAVDGATRMKALVLDLLNYSRVGRSRDFHEPVDLGASCDAAIANLELLIRETGATVSRDELPTVLADEAQSVQLFQNLIGNALKYRSDCPPEVHIAAAKQDDEWVVSISDNGIGIPEESRDRIFLIFQRLHGRGEYSGTGIGLAVCKKIVEHLGGRIWVGSRSQGSIFHLTFPTMDDEDENDHEQCNHEPQECGEQLVAAAD